MVESLERSNEVYSLAILRPRREPAGSDSILRLKIGRRREAWPRRCHNLAKL
jgi:hypothetical protein